MPTLGDQFPRELREAYAQASLIPGAVIYRYCDFTTPQKNKFLVVACVEPKLLVLVINSSINEFIKMRPALNTCQVPVKKEEHSFLDHDSFANCIDALEVICWDDLKEEINRRFGDLYKGRLSENCIRDVIAAVNASPTMLRPDKRHITSALNAALSKQ